MKNKVILYIIIPCYNEEKVLPITSGMFLQKLQSLVNQEIISDKSRIMFVNDGSKIGHGRLFVNWQILMSIT